MASFDKQIAQLTVSVKPDEVELEHLRSNCKEIADLWSKLADAYGKLSKIPQLLNKNDSEVFRHEKDGHVYFTTDKNFKPPETKPREEMIAELNKKIEERSKGKRLPYKDND